MYAIGVDAGNSRIKMGLFYNARLIDTKTIGTQDISSLKIPTRWKVVKPELIGLASVVPSVNPVVVDRLQRFYRVRVWVIKPSDCGIRLGIKNPDKVGVDRVLNCRAGLHLCGSPVVVVDVGTAITVDIVTSRGGFMGGSIIPGPELWVKVLTSTALIKKSSPARNTFPGRDTDESISCGIRYGIAGAVNGILNESLKKYPSARIVLTGGGIEILRKSISFRCVVKNHLTLEGIGLVLHQKYGD